MILFQFDSIDFMVDGKFADAIFTEINWYPSGSIRMVRPDRLLQL
jgi:hypothetical protein